MNDPLNTFSLTIPAVDAKGNQGVIKLPMPGVMLLIDSASAPFTMQFDTDTPFNCKAGFKFRDPQSPFKSVTFFNSLTAPIILSVFIGSLSVDYVGANEMKPALTQPLGNFGVTSEAGVAAVFGQKCTGLVITNNGSGYTVGDLLMPPDGTFSVPLQIQVTRVNHAGSIQATLIISAGNFSVLPVLASHVIQGTGAGAILTLTFAALTNAVLHWSTGWLTLTNVGNLVIPAGRERIPAKRFRSKSKPAAPPGCWSSMERATPCATWWRARSAILKAPARFRSSPMRRALALSPCGKPTIHEKLLCSDHDPGIGGPVHAWPNHLDTPDAQSGLQQ